MLIIRVVVKCVAVALMKSVLTPGHHRRLDLNGFHIIVKGLVFIPPWVSAQAIMFPRLSVHTYICVCVCSLGCMRMQMWRFNFMFKFGKHKLSRFNDEHLHACRGVRKKCLLLNQTNPVIMMHEFYHVYMWQLNRCLAWWPVPPADLLTSVWKQLQPEKHPCHVIFSITVSTHSSRCPWRTQLSPSL